MSQKYNYRQYNDILKVIFTKNDLKDGLIEQDFFERELRVKFAYRSDIQYILEEQAERAYKESLRTGLDESTRQMFLTKHDKLMKQAKEKLEYENMIAPKVASVYKELRNVLDSCDANTRFRIGKFLSKEKVYREDLIALYDACERYCSEHNQSSSMVSMLFKSNLSALSSENIATYDLVGGFYRPFETLEYSMDEVGANFMLRDNMVLFVKTPYIGNEEGTDYKEWLSENVKKFYKDFNKQCTKVHAKPWMLTIERKKYTRECYDDYHIELIPGGTDIISRRKEEERLNNK